MCAKRQMNSQRVEKRILTSISHGSRILARHPATNKQDSENRRDHSGNYGAVTVCYFSDLHSAGRSKLNVTSRLLRRRLPGRQIRSEFHNRQRFPTRRRSLSPGSAVSNDWYQHRQRRRSISPRLRASNKACGSHNCFEILVTHIT